MLPPERRLPEVRRLIEQTCAWNDGAGDLP
jgi:hypothetical protein